MWHTHVWAQFKAEEGNLFVPCSPNNAYSCDLKPVRREFFCCDTKCLLKSTPAHAHRACCQRCPLSQAVRGAAGWRSFDDAPRGIAALQQQSHRLHARSHDTQIAIPVRPLPYHYVFTTSMEYDTVPNTPLTIWHPLQSICQLSPPTGLEHSMFAVDWPCLPVFATFFLQ